MENLDEAVKTRMLGRTGERVSIDRPGRLPYRKP